MQESASFWTDIKNLEEQLAKSPDSLCFARLADVYLKVGLADDALHVARLGVTKHPRYLSGQRAFSLACHAKGLNDEALAALRLVVEALPEDVSSQKLLGRLLVEAGNQNAACQAFRIALEFAPNDVECRIELESLERSVGGRKPTFEADDDDEEIIDLEILVEDDLPEEQPASVLPFRGVSPEPDSATHHDPLSTGTLAELYVRQGFVHKALEIYRAILADNPEDRATADRVAELETLEEGRVEAVPEFNTAYDEEVEEEPASSTPFELLFQETGLGVLSQPAEISVLDTQSDGFVQENNSPLASPKGVADNALSALDGWLENIRRIKSCR